MSNQTDTEPLMIIVPVEESCCCLRCCQEIPAHRVLKNIRGVGQFGTPREEIRANCEHCRTWYALDREIRNGAWQIIGSVKVIAAEKEAAALNRKLDALLHNRQLA